MEPDWATKAAIICLEEAKLALRPLTQAAKDDLVAKMATAIRIQCRQRCDHCGAPVERRCAC